MCEGIAIFIYSGTCVFDNNSDHLKDSTSIFRNTRRDIFSLTHIYMMDNLSHAWRHGGVWNGRSSHPRRYSLRGRDSQNDLGSARNKSQMKEDLQAPGYRPIIDDSITHSWQKALITSETNLRISPRDSLPHTFPSDSGVGLDPSNDILHGHPYIVWKDSCWLQLVWEFVGILFRKSFPHQRDDTRRIVCHTSQAARPCVGFDSWPRPTLHPWLVTLSCCPHVVTCLLDTSSLEYDFQFYILFSPVPISSFWALPVLVFKRQKIKGHFSFFPYFFARLIYVIGFVPLF